MIYEYRNYQQPGRSDAGMYIINNDGVLYAEAIDPMKFKEIRIYTETDQPIETEEDNQEEQEQGGSETANL